MPLPNTPPAGGDVRSMMSVFSPTDMAAKVGSGMIRPDMTISEFFKTNFNLDPDTNTVSDLAQAFAQQAKTRDVPGKLQAMQAQPQPIPAPEPGGMAGLMSKIQ